MAQTSSAKKALRVTSRRRVFNVRTKAKMKDAIKATRKMITAKDEKGSIESLSTLYKAFDKAAKKGTIKKNAAARMKSRLTKRATSLNA